MSSQSVLMIEAQSRYINALIGAIIDARKKGGYLTITPNSNRMDEYNAAIQKILNASSFAHPSCNSWYKNADGMPKPLTNTPELIHLAFKV